MKKVILLLGIVLLMGVSNSAESQVSINVNINSQPAWGPTGYESANFYYFPDLNIYFDVDNSLFYYLSNSNWVSDRYLPGKYSKYNFYDLYKVVINNDSKPWLKNKEHKKEYSEYKGNKTQIPIRNSTESKYEKSKDNSTVWVNNDNNKSKKKSNSKEKQSTGREQQSTGRSQQSNGSQRSK